MCNSVTTDLNKQLNEIAYECCRELQTPNYVHQLMVRSAIDKALEAVLRAEPSEEEIQAGVQEWIKHNHGWTYDEEISAIRLAMSAALLKSLKERT